MDFNFMYQPNPFTGYFMSKSGTVARGEAAAGVEGSRVIRPRQPTSWALLGANECGGWGEASAGWSWGNPPIYPAGLILKAPEQSKNDWKMKKRPAGQRFLEVTLVSRRKPGPFLPSCGIKAAWASLPPNIQKGEPEYTAISPSGGDGLPSDSS